MYLFHLYVENETINVYEFTLSGHMQTSQTKGLSQQYGHMFTAANLNHALNVMTSHVYKQLPRAIGLRSFIRSRCTHPTPAL